MGGAFLRGATVGGRDFFEGFAGFGRLVGFETSPGVDVGTDADPGASLPGIRPGREGELRAGESAGNPSPPCRGGGGALVVRVVFPRDAGLGACVSGACFGARLARGIVPGWNKVVWFGGIYRGTGDHVTGLEIFPGRVSGGGSGSDFLGGKVCHAAVVVRIMSSGADEYRGRAGGDGGMRRRGRLIVPGFSIRFSVSIRSSYWITVFELGRGLRGGRDGR